MAERLAGVNKLYFISQMPLFSDLSWSEKRTIASRAYAVEYKKGEIVYQKGDAPDALYCLATGRLQIFITRQDGHAETLEYLHKGGYTGIISLITGEAHSVSVRAINDSIVLKIDKSDFDFILKRTPRLSVHISQTLSRRLKRKDLHAKTIFESTIISIYSHARGTGCTTYAINLALSLAKETSKRVILLDVSPSGKIVSRALGLKVISNAIDLCETNFDYNKARDTILHYPKGVDILSIKHDPDRKSDITHITPLLTYLASDYHYIITDLPSHIDHTVFKALAQSDIIHIITNPVGTMLESTHRLIDRLEKSVPESVPKIKIIVNELKEKGLIGLAERQRMLKRKIYGTIPAVYSVGQKLQPESATIVISQPDSEYACMVRRIARDIGGVLIGLALGSGAALGFVHIGVLKVLEREKIPIDIIVGSSIGAVIAALWAIDKSSKEVENIAIGFRNKLSLLKLIDPIMPKSGLIGGRGAMNILKRHLGRKTFQDVAMPLKIIACDINRREVVVLDEGNLQDAVRASIAIPGIFKPVKCGEKILVDGGILEPVPVGTLVRMGTNKIIAVNPLPGPEDVIKRLGRTKRQAEENMKKSFMEAPANYIRCRILKFLERIFMPNIFDVMVNTILSMEYEMAEVACQQADIVIHPRIASANWYEFFNADELIRIGEREAERLLPKIKDLVKE